MDGYPPSFYNQPRFPPTQPNPNPPKEHSSKAMFWVLGLILLVIIGVIAYLLIAPGSEESSDVNLPGETQSSPETSQSLVSCEDWGCFINASQNCSKANFTLTQNVDFLGINITNTQYYELKGLENNQCKFYLNNTEQHIKYTDELRQQMLDVGATQEEIDLQEQQGNGDADLTEGLDGQCLIRSSDLTNLMGKWRDGNSSGGVSCALGGNCTYSGDWEVFNNCSGTYFNTGTF